MYEKTVPTILTFFKKTTTTNKTLNKVASLCPMYEFTDEIKERLPSIPVSEGHSKLRTVLKALALNSVM